MSDPTTCPTCAGFGAIPKGGYVPIDEPTHTTCPTCHGAGQVAAEQTPTEARELEAEVRRVVSEYGDYRSGVYQGSVVYDLDQASFTILALITTEANRLAGERIKPAIDHSIDVRYAPTLEVAFNRFIKKWCGKYYSHLIDSDDNDGQFIRDRISAYTKGIQQ
jgi:hypothetical protein